MTAWPRTVTPFEVTELSLPGPLISKSQGGKVQVRGNLQIGRTWRESYLLKVSNTTHRSFLATVRNYWRNGTIFTVQHVDHTTLLGAGGGSPIVQAATQLVTEPEDFSAWSAGGTPVLTAGQADPFGGTAAYLIEDNDGAVTESVTLVVTFTGNATKSFAVFMKAGTATSSAVRVQDATAVATRVQISVTWTAGVPSLAVAGGSGVAYTVEDYGDGWYRICFTADSIVAGNSNQFIIFPAGTTSADTGTVYIFGANAWNEVSPARYSGDSVLGNDAVGNRLHINGATPVANWVRGGDLISVPVGSLNYVLEVGADVTTQTNGYAAIPITPPLFTGGTPSDNAAVSTTSVLMRCLLLEPPSWPTSSGQSADYGELSCVFGEAL